MKEPPHSLDVFPLHDRGTRRTHDQWIHEVNVVTNAITAHSLYASPLQAGTIGSLVASATGVLSERLTH